MFVWDRRKGGTKSFANLFEGVNVEAIEEDKRRTVDWEDVQDGENMEVIVGV